MNVLLSIKPKYLEKIASGCKQYEFRKSIFKNTNIERIYIYSTSPVKKIVGSFSLGDIIKENPQALWNICENYSGLSKEKFFEYFKGYKEGYALEIENIEFFKEPFDPYQYFSNFYPPQSFYYINKELENVLIN